MGTDGEIVTARAVADATERTAAAVTAERVCSGHGNGDDDDTDLNNGIIWN